MTDAARRPGPGPAIALLFTRLALVAVATTGTWLVVAAGDPDASFPPSPMLAALGLLPVNVVSLLLVARLLRAEGPSLPRLFAPRGGLLREIGWGLLWIVTLYVPFALAVLATMWVLHGSNAFTAFETVFYDPTTASVASPAWALALGVVAVVTFAPLNAPAEEAVFRGYAQGVLTNAWSSVPAIGACSLVFGLQHAFFAPTADAMIVYVVAFTVWGIGSGVIVRRQRRLLPITIAHFVVNLTTSSPAVIFPVLQAVPT